MTDLIDWRGNDLDLAIKAGGRISMRRHGHAISLETHNGINPVCLTPAEVAEVVASLVAAIALAAQDAE